MAGSWRWRVLGLAAAFACAGAGCFEWGFGPRCGNGLQDDGETCDDGNDINGDGCSARCDLELCLDCGVCGDGIQSDGEQCDDGNLADDDGCSSGCLLEVIGECGDGIITLGEQCDDGNNASGDGCDAFCRLEIAPGNCGNGVLEPGEFCDTEFGCNPDCIYSCVEAACQQPILTVAESGAGRTVGEPMVGHPPGSVWAVAWRSESPTLFPLVPAAAFDGNSAVSSLPALDTDGLYVEGPAFVGTSTGYFYASVRLDLFALRPQRWLTPDLIETSASTRFGAIAVAAAGRKETPAGWIIATDGDQIGLERLDMPSLQVEFLADDDPAAVSEHPPVVAVHVDGSATVAYAYGVPPVFAVRSITADGNLGAETPFAGEWGPEGPAIVALDGDAYAIMWRDAVTYDLEILVHRDDSTEIGILVDTGVALADAAPAAASASSGNGDFAIAWSVDEAGCRRIRVLKLDALGQAYGTPFELDGGPFIGSGTDCNSREPALDVAPGGEVVLAWSGCPPGLGICPVIQARRFPELLP